jgi:tetratricopeptide (TPR) repeat protein
MRLKLLLIFFLLSAGLNVYCQDAAKEVYLKALQAAIEDKPDLSVVYLSSIVDSQKNSKYYSQALFGSGEYYFQIKDYTQAKSFFNKVLKSQPVFEEKVFALAYLLNIFRKANDTQAIKDISMEIVKLNPISLVFKDRKEYFYKSVMNKKYKAIYFIDHLQIQVDKKEFEKISLQ